MARLGEMEEIPSRPGFADSAARLDLERDSSATAGNYSRAQLDDSVCERRQTAERLAGALNELAGEPIARAHHGSLAAAQRSVIEEQLKAGQIKALCATSTLELGIDMGAVDLVIQIESPPSVASGMQRIGRAGHHVDAVSEGILFPKYRADLVACAAVTRAMHDGHIESTRFPRNPLDVLCQQLVAIVASATAAEGVRGPKNRRRRAGTGQEPRGEFAICRIVNRAETPRRRSSEARSLRRFLFDLVRGAAPFGSLSRSAFDGVLDLLSGRYPSDEFGELRPRLTWDRVRNVVTARDGAARLAILNAGTIPDRGLYGVFLAFTEGKPVRVGELDEEMVFESHPNETFILGASTWRIIDITHDRVLVTPAPGEPGKMPFWKGDGPGRPLEFGRRIGAMVRELRALPQAAALTRLVDEHDLDPGAAENLFALSRRSGRGDWPGSRRSDDCGRALPRRAGRLARLRAHAVRQPHSHSLGDGGEPRASAPPAARRWKRCGATTDSCCASPTPTSRPTPIGFLSKSAEAMQLVLRQLGSTALFAGRFREAAGRALLLPRRRADQRSPLWQLRKRSYDLLSVASRYPSFPLLLEAYRECLRDVFDMPALIETLRAIEQRQLRVHVVETRKPSPFAASLLFSYVANFVYEGDAPLAERRAQALTIDQDQLRELLGEADLRELLDADAIAEVEEAAQCLAENYRARSADGIHDLCLRLGDLSREELAPPRRFR